AMECVIVHDLFLNETANFAHVFLPGCTFLEKDGTFTNAERRISRVRRVMPPKNGMADWEITLALAKAMGADVLVRADTQDVVAEVMQATGNEGADLVCEMSGHPVALAQAFKACRLGGRVNLLGLPKGEVKLNLSNDVIFRGLTVYGVIGRRMYETWHQMRTFLSASRPDGQAARTAMFDPRPVITHTFPLEKINDALEAIRSGQAGKVILEIA
ncbi:MAG: zinc-binding dehydrogenase, partial [Gemmatimonadales bacterium]